MPVPSRVANAPMPAGYQFVRVLGGGGCGWVALARHGATGRLVAIKTLHAGNVDPTERRRLEREGRALARLSDPRVVAVHAVTAIGDDLALVLEYVAGGDLQDALDDERLDGPARLRVLGDTAAALDAAARAGMVHRDVKPSNVLVPGDDSPAKLTDFGIARIGAVAGAFRTGTSAPIGTPRYMAPEQILHPEVESPAADAYSFAVMAYEVLLGRPPFAATDTLALLYAHVRMPPTPPRQVRPVSPQAEAALLAGLAKQPRDRPTPLELVGALAAHPADWAHHRSRPRRVAPTAVPPRLPAGGEPTAAPGEVLVPDSVPVIAAAPAPTMLPPPGRRRTLPPVATGALAALVLTALVLALVLLL